MSTTGFDDEEVFGDIVIDDAEMTMTGQPQQNNSFKEKSRGFFCRILAIEGLETILRLVGGSLGILLLVRVVLDVLLFRWITGKN